jgi:hypothetical protein
VSRPLFTFCFGIFLRVIEGQSGCKVTLESLDGFGLRLLGSVSLVQEIPRQFRRKRPSHRGSEQCLQLTPTPHFLAKTSNKS